MLLISAAVQLWKRRGTTDKIENPIVKNDTIYCNYLSNGINYVAAYNPVNGTEFWKKSITEKWGADRLIAEGTMLYYLSIQTNRDIIVNGFDLTTRTVKWQRNIGITTSIAYSDMALDGNQLL
ncbi:MAG: hypothetical protein IPL50_12185 [Chitinophagaceae bacterium]|nr:hypothetical protein [Chitinophagaceae bacterium]